MARQRHSGYVFHPGRGISHAVAKVLSGCFGFEPAMYNPTYHKPWGNNNAGYGILEGVWAAFQDTRAAGGDFFYCDNAYFPSAFRNFFRVVKNRTALTEIRDTDPTRFDNLRIPIEPWKRGRHIVIALQTDIWHQTMGAEPLPIRISNPHALGFAESVRRELKRYTDRPVVIREKGRGGLGRALENAHALVTFSSSAGVDALLMGIPVFCLGNSPAKPCALTDLSLIESPWYPDNRRELMASLANNQWSLEEISRGMPKESLCEH